MSKNDERILILKKQIEEQKRQLKEQTSVKEQQYKTNKIIELDGVKYNLNVIQEEAICEILTTLGGKLCAMNILLNEYEIMLRDKYTISGYTVDDWISDLKYHLLKLEAKRKEKALKQKEEQLDKLLSEDKKTELMLDELTKSLGI